MPAGMLPVGFFAGGGDGEVCFGEGELAWLEWLWGELGCIGWVGGSGSGRRCGCAVLFGRRRVVGFAIEQRGGCEKSEGGLRRQNWMLGITSPATWAIRNRTFSGALL